MPEGQFFVKLNGEPERQMPVTQNTFSSVVYYYGVKLMQRPMLSPQEHVSTMEVKAVMDDETLVKVNDKVKRPSWKFKFKGGTVRYVSAPRKRKS